ncbi:MAG TPA: protein phosphatase 2C domain-containing protein [Thermoanaerobaculia bacterium]
MAAPPVKRPLAACLSDPGMERDNNEDRVLCDPERGIYAVIDGVGGESGGEIAAQTAMEILQARLSRRTTDAARLVREAIALANKQIYERAQANPALTGMACVLTVAVVDGSQVTIGHVGDSRLYLLKKGEIRKITKDHSPVGSREDVGEISEAEAMSHPRRNEIFRDVGSAPHEPDEEGFVDVTRIPFEPDAALLICSDGLSDLVPSRTILSTVEAHAGNPKGAAQALIDEANAAGGKDNVSVVIVEGERFASGARGRQLDATQDRPRPRMQGAAHARSSRPSPLASRPAFLLYGLLLGALLAVSAFAAFGQMRLPFLDRGQGREDALRVGVGDGGTATIGEAMSQARSGQTVLVAPGEYRETVQLREGVRLVSAVPRGAVILPPPGSGVPAVTAQGVVDAGFHGFRIAGDPQTPLQVGLRLADSEVDVEGVEISGAVTAAIEITGADRSSVRYSFLHGNPGGGVIVSAQSAPRLLHNLIASNGHMAVPRPGVEVREGARPDLVENRIAGNGGGAVVLPSAERAQEIFNWNSFGGAPIDRAIRVVSAPQPAGQGSR